MFVSLDPVVAFNKSHSYICLTSWLCSVTTRPSRSILLIGRSFKMYILKYPIFKWDQLIKWSKSSSLKESRCFRETKIHRSCQDHLPSRWQKKMRCSIGSKEETPQENMLKNRLQPCCGHRITNLNFNQHHCTPYNLKVNAKLVFSSFSSC